MRFFSKRLFLILALVVASAFPGCKCGEESTDVPRLKAQINTSKVHFYVAAKVAIAGSEDAATSEEARQKFIQLIQAASKIPVKDGKVDWPALSLTDTIVLGKAVFELKALGAEIASGEKKETRPLLNPILAAAGAAEPVAQYLDISTEHAMLFLVMAVLKFHEVSPVPIPPEILLYEAWNTNPDEVKVPGAKIPLHGVKAWIYGNNDYCDLAQQESDATEVSSEQALAALSGLNALTGKGSALQAAHMEQVLLGFRFLGHGGVFMCHMARDDREKARPAIKELIDDARAMGIPEDEIAWMRVFYDCMGDEEETKKGLVALAALETQKPGEPILPGLRAYCEAADETSFDATRKVVLMTKLAHLSMSTAKRYGVTAEVENSTLYKTAGGFVNLTEKVAKGADGAAGALDKAKGLLNLLNSGEKQK